MIEDNFYTTYNARHLAPKEIAKTFIWSESFGKLIQNNHSIILGARGCGKTTLMKMLTIPALHAWKSERAEDIKSNIPFYSVYISTDIYWNVKNQTYSSQLEGYGSLSEQISHFAVNSNVFGALCDTFLNIISIELEDNDEDKEVELCQNLIKAWKLHRTIPKLKFVKEAIYERVDEVNQLIQEIIFNYNPSEKLPNSDYFTLSFESSLEVIIPKFERIYGIEGRKKWALCFDELEFAPDWLREKLFGSLRSRTQYLLYKLSSSPILPSELEKALESEYGPSSGNDVQLIKMWSSDDNEQFSRKIIQSFLKADQEMASVFGSNDLYNKATDSYIEGSEFYRATLELVAKDDAFRAFLSDKGVDPEKPILSDKHQKDTLFRKIKPIVHFRNTFLDSNKRNRHVVYRSRKKAPELYSGIEVVTKICDGNPRWLIGIMSQYMGKLSATSGNHLSKVDQYNELVSAANRFKNVIANIPVGNCNLTIVDLVDRIGEHFRLNVLGAEFQMDPKGTFIVDESEDQVRDDIVELIEKGVAQGAFILLDSKDNSFDFEIRGQRFKLAYLFALLHDLPLRNYPSAKLSECLSNNLNLNQPSLFS